MATTLIVGWFGCLVWFVSGSLVVVFLCVAVPLDCVGLGVSSGFGVLWFARVLVAAVLLLLWFAVVIGCSCCGVVACFLYFGCCL